ncbi:MAG: alpha/beta hydrolase [Actinobacteria bacterium]|nr:alpha/beta hydrolase [Actinomycetota bacterium]
MAFVELDRVRLHVVERGSGDPLVIVHGAAASTVSVEPLLEGLSRTRRVIAFDLRGMGRSTAVEEMPPTAWNDDLIALLDHLELARVDLLGVSLGARIALRAALDRPERVRALVLDAPIVADSPEGSAAVERIFGAEIPPALAAGLEHWNGPTWREVAARFLRLRLTPGLQDHYALGGLLDGVEQPVLVCRGDVDDPIHPLAHAFEVHARIAGSQLWIAPGTPFSATRFRPDEAVGQIERFLATI